jgi:asparagine synthase (glutamine-hydrolysing)
MCGIGGIVMRSGRVAEPGELLAMAERIRHRGPDDRGFATYSPSGRLEVARDVGALTPAHVGLLHLRLSIIDTSDRGWQPMGSADGRYAIVFNGEIYNFVELRDRLQREGHEFRSASDTEVLLTAWAAWGPACLTQLVGMFAFAILDIAANTLTLARDGFGIKPLFYLSDATRFAFASEVKALLPLMSGPRRVNASRVFDYLRAGLTDRDGTTLIDGVNQVPIGHWGTFGLSDSSDPTFTPFWQPRRGETLDLSYDEAVRQTRDLFVKSVRLHLRSDVPVGACLSGGIDSSSIVALMRELEGDALDLRTFTYVSDSEAQSEARWASLAGDDVRAVQHCVTPSAEDLTADLEMLIQCQDEPFGSTSIYAQHRVFRLAAENGIKVVLDGQGADEMLGGYAHHSGARLAALIRQGRLGAARRFWGGTPTGYGGARYGRLMAAQYLVPSSAHGLLRRLVGRSVVPPWLNESWFRAQGKSQFSLDTRTGGDLRDELVADVRGNLPSLLRYEDRNSMHFSVESRVPFLTPELCDFFLALPDEFIISSDGVSKSILRAAMRGIVPNEILDRRDKVGFQTPEWQWMQRVRPWAERILQSDVARGLPVFRYDQLLAAWRQSLSHPSQHHTWVWRWINFIRWVELNDIAF